MEGPTVRAKEVQRANFNAAVEVLVLDLSSLSAPGFCPLLNDTAPPPTQEPLLVEERCCWFCLLPRVPQVCWICQVCNSLGI